MNIERIILSIIDDAKPRMIATFTLWSELRMETDRVSYAGFQSAMRKLEEKEQIVVIIGEDRDKAKITQAGEARLAE